MDKTYNVIYMSTKQKVSFLGPKKLLRELDAKIKDDGVYSHRTDWLIAKMRDDLGRSS